MNSVLMLLAKSVLLPYGLSAVMSATDADIKVNHGLCRPSDLASRTTALIIWNEEMEDITKIVNLLGESGLQIKRIGETIKNEAKEQKSRFLPMLLGTLVASILGNISCWYITKCINMKRSNKGKWRSNNSRSKFLIPPYPLTNFEILSKYYINKNITKMNLNLMVFIKEIIYLK